MPKSVTIVVFVLHICLDYRCVDVRFVIFRTVVIFSSLILFCSIIS